jgi:hypothetical protein
VLHPELEEAEELGLNMYQVLIIHNAVLEGGSTLYCVPWPDSDPRWWLLMMVARGYLKTSLDKLVLQRLACEAISCRSQLILWTSFARVGLCYLSASVPGCQKCM